MPTDDIKRILQAGDDIAPPEALWTRLQADRRTLVRRRRALAGASASLCALALAAVVAWPALDHGETAGPATVQVASRDADEIRDDLRAIDLALQVAYDRGASDLEIAPMWDMRNALATEMNQQKELDHDGI